MDAGRLREAARVLRERAEVATPGPWASSVSDDRRWALVDAGEAIVSRSATDEDATHIATMHPGVALALADWLEAFVYDIDFMDIDPDREPAIRVADLILGGAS